MSLKRKNHYRSILHIIIWHDVSRTCGKMTTFAEKENPVLSKQCTVSQLSCCHGENPRITVWTVWPSALLTRSSPKRLLFVHSSKNCARRTEIFVKWRGTIILQRKTQSTIWTCYRDGSIAGRNVLQGVLQVCYKWVTRRLC